MPFRGPPWTLFLLSFLKSAPPAPTHPHPATGTITPSETFSLRKRPTLLTQERPRARPGTNNARVKKSGHGRVERHPVAGEPQEDLGRSVADGPSPTRPARPHDCQEQHKVHDRVAEESV